MTEERAFELLQDLNGMTREEAIEVMELHLIEFKHDFGWNRTTIKAMEMAVEALEEPEQHGQWIKDESGDYKCSECGSREDQFIYGREIWYGNGESNFCPNCGSYNRGE